MSHFSAAIQLSLEQWAQMESDAITRAPEEACGFVVGTQKRASKIIPITNILHDPYRFRMDPGEELRAFLLAEEASEEILAVYHSHPQGIDHPSESDMSELSFPGIIYLIWYQALGSWSCRAYLMEGSTRYSEVPLQISTNLER